MKICELNRRENPQLNFVLISVSLPSDPKGWSREDVAVFLAYCEKEFDLEKIDMDKFQMNGKSQDVLKESFAQEIVLNIFLLSDIYLKVFSPKIS